MDLTLTSLIEEVSVEEIKASQDASKEVLRQYQEDPALSSHLVMMAFN